MKLLIISNNPERASFRQRIGIYLDMFKKSGIEFVVKRLPKRFSQRKELFQESRRYDAVFLHKKRLNMIDSILLRRYSTKIIYDFDDAVMYSEKKPQSANISRKRAFRRVIRMSDIVIAGNTYLAEHAKRYNKAVHVLPTGLCLSNYDLQIQKDNTAVRLVWIGSESTLPYLHEISGVLEDIGKQYPNAALRIICDKFIDLKKIPVEKKIWSLDSQYQDVCECHIGLAPLPDDNFTRGKCGFKILQYYAAKAAVIASPVGANCDIIDDNKTGFLAASKQEWFDKISRLIESSTLRSNLTQNATHAVMSYDKHIFGKKLCQIILGQEAP